MPMHAHCPRADLAFKSAMDDSHESLDLVSSSMQDASAFWNNSPARLPVLQAVAVALEVSILKFGYHCGD